MRSRKALISSFTLAVPEMNDPADPTAEDPVPDAGPHGTGCAKSVGRGCSEISLNADAATFGGKADLARASPTHANHGGKICSGTGEDPTADAAPETAEPCGMK